MKMRFFLALLTTGTGIGTLVVDPPVNLQSSTPGTAQTGHVNVTGTVLAGTVLQV